MRMLKECTACGERKPIRSAFRAQGDGFHSWCRDCEAEDKRAARKRKASA